MLGQKLGGSRGRDVHAVKAAVLARWRLAVGALLLLSVHTLSANFLVPIGHPRASEGTTRRRLAVHVQQSFQQVTLQGSGVEFPKGGATALAAVDGNLTDAWAPTGRALKRRQLLPSSVATWRCGEGSPESEADSSIPFAYDLVMGSKTYVKEFGGHQPWYKWCRGEVPWLVPQLRRVVLLESSKPQPERGLTIVTQLSLERLSMLENQCRMWPNHIAAALYVPLLYGRIFSAEDATWNKSSLDVGIAQALRFHAAMEASGACILDLELVAEERCSSEQAMLYPVNAVRNRALKIVKTEAVLLLDVDFGVSDSLADIVRSSKQYEQLMQTLWRKFAVVLPAFEAWDNGETGRQLAIDCLTHNKSFVASQYSWNMVTGFHMGHFPKGHATTDYWRWINATSMYEITYENGYEPYILMATKYVPWYDERFRGYYWNKIQHLMHIATQFKFQFVVHPSAFVVHLPHPKPATRSLTKASGQKEINFKMFKDALGEMRKKKFVPATAFPQDCLGTSGKVFRAA